MSQWPKLSDTLPPVHKLMPDALRWTTDPPTESGWYWAEAQGCKWPIIIKVALLDGAPVEWNSEHRRWWPLGGVIRWAGPIPMPEEPHD